MAGAVIEHMEDRAPRRAEALHSARKRIRDVARELLKNPRLPAAPRGLDRFHAKLRRDLGEMRPHVLVVEIHAERIFRRHGRCEPHFHRALRVACALDAAAVHPMAVRMESRLSRHQRAIFAMPSRSVVFGFHPKSLYASRTSATNTR